MMILSWKDGVFMYKSKKLKKYVEFKEKSLKSVYIEITKGRVRCRSCNF
jgi:hypothetical protein